MNFLSVNFKFNDTVLPMKKANWVNFTEFLLLHFISLLDFIVLFYLQYTVSVSFSASMAPHMKKVLFSN